MFIRMLTGGLIAGVVAGLVAGALHFVFLQDIILEAELYESGEKVHFDAAGQSGPSGADGADHDAPGHDHGADHGAAGHDDGGVEWIGRNALTIVFGTIVYAGYGLMLAATLQGVRQAGRRISASAGVLWGLAGYATFQFAPAMGLPAELPGTISAGIGLRQTWWFAATVATGVGLAIMAYGRTPVFVATGAVIIAAPHVIGAPQLDTMYGLAPPELAAEFAVRGLGVGLVAWMILGWLTARLTRPDAA